MDMANNAVRERLFFVDWLRIGAFGLLVLYHVGMVYVPWRFHIKHPTVYRTLEPFMRLTSPWRMSLLFLVSGLSTGLMLGRPRLLRERARRLLPPLALGVFVIVPPQAYVQVVEQFGYGSGYLAFMRLYLTGYHGFCNGADCLRLPTWNHLWFLPYLLCYTGLLAAMLRVVPRSSLSRLADQLALMWAGAWLVLPVLMLYGARVVLYPRFEETHALIDDWWAHAVYGTMFAIGVLLARRRSLLLGLGAWRWPALVAAVVAWAAMAALWHARVDPTAWADGWRAIRRLLWVTEQWCAVVAALGFAQRHWNVDHVWRSPLNEAIFPLYLVHQTFIVLGEFVLRPLALPAGWEAATLVVFAVAGSLACWGLSRRIPWLRPWMGMGRSRSSPVGVT